jgi:hypothetical protein
MSFITSSIYSQLALANKLNAQQQIFSGIDQQRGIMNQVSQLAMTNPDALSDPAITQQLFNYDKSFTMQNQQNQLNLKLFEQQKELSDKFTKSGLEDYKNSLNFLA